MGDSQPFRVFVSSPVYGIERFRYAVLDAARAARGSGRFEFFFFEEKENCVTPGMTICESIFKANGHNFDALFIFFKDRVGQGTIDELEYFQNVIYPMNPSCEIWWTQIYSNSGHSSEVTTILEKLNQFNTGIPIIPGRELISTPHDLALRFTAKLWHQSTIL